MRILLVHNFYQQAGGEDVVFKNESALLQRYGHTVFHYTAANDDLSHIAKLRAAQETIWSKTSHQQLQRTLRETKPTIAHFHNTFMRISPSAYYACRDAGVAVVQTLHNYRLLCPTATFYRNGEVCEQCLGQKFPISSIQHTCYRHSFTQTATVAAMLTVHRMLSTWHTQITSYIALTQFARRKFIQGGLPQDKIYVKPNFVQIEQGERNEHEPFVLFVGRLSPEKGIGLLMQACNQLRHIPIKIVGDGPLREEIAAYIHQEQLNHVEILGKRPHHEIYELMRKAAFLVFPSQWYEGFPVTIIEAFAIGLPVVATKLGAIAEVIHDGKTGLHFEAGNVSDLVAKIEWAWAHPKERVVMGKSARAEYEQFYTAEQNYKELIAIYEQTINSN